jgi:3'-phosphoadenosine 5'-phosphosulfate sulfotransferase (PAPS reductase)/FAD synthetase
MSERPTRHILSLSGGKDSTALAIYMRDRVAGMEYVFCDTGEELPETYEYLDRIEAYLGQPIVRLNPDRPFSHFLDIYRGVLPDARTRWCTRMLKIKPFERYVGDDPVVSYIAIRADELHRKGYISTKPNITTIYPFIEGGMVKEDVYRILEESGIGLPEYYKWRSRSGCYFCFFQQRNEWVGLLEQHPDLFEKATQFEKIDPITGERFTWNQKESLRELAMPERQRQIKEQAERRGAQKSRKANQSLVEVLEDDDPNQSCLICHL